MASITTRLFTRKVFATLEAIKNAMKPVLYCTGLVLFVVGLVLGFVLITWLIGASVKCGETVGPGFYPLTDCMLNGVWSEMGVK